MMGHHPDCRYLDPRVVDGCVPGCGWRQLREALIAGPAKPWQLERRPEATTPDVIEFSLPPMHLFGCEPEAFCLAGCPWAASAAREFSGKEGVLRSMEGDFVGTPGGGLPPGYWRDRAGRLRGGPDV